MAGPESRIRSRFHTLAQRAGWLVLTQHGSVYSGPGRSDTLLLAPPQGTAVFIEWKAEGGTPTKKQLEFIQDVRRVGGYAFLARSATLAYKAVCCLLAGARPYQEGEIEVSNMADIENILARIQNGNGAATLARVGGPAEPPDEVTPERRTPPEAAPPVPETIPRPGQEPTAPDPDPTRGPATPIPQPEPAPAPSNRRRGRPPGAKAAPVLDVEGSASGRTEALGLSWAEAVMRNTAAMVELTYELSGLRGEVVALTEAIHPLHREEASV
jgi:hypothetical protein